MRNDTKILEYAIKYLYNTIKMDTKNIAKELGTTRKNVEKILDLGKESHVNTTTSNADSPAPNPVINKTVGNRSGVSIMTEAASTRADQIMSQAESVVSRTARNAIFRPRN